MQTLHSLFRQAANFANLLLLNQYQWLGEQCKIPTGNIRTEIIKLSVSGFIVKIHTHTFTHTHTDSSNPQQNLILCFLQVLSSRYYYISIMWCFPWHRRLVLFIVEWAIRGSVCWLLFFLVLTGLVTSLMAWFGIVCRQSAAPQFLSQIHMKTILVDMAVLYINSVPVIVSVNKI